MATSVDREQEVQTSFDIEVVTLIRPLESEILNAGGLSRKHREGTIAIWPMFAEEWRRVKGGTAEMI